MSQSFLDQFDEVFYEDSSLWGLSNLPEYKTEEDVKDIIAE